MKKKQQERGPLVTLTIDGYSSDGAGVARLDGQVVFVTGGIRGETCKVRLDKIGRSAIWGHAEQVTDPSSQRLTPDCPYYQQCGGCRFRHMAYAEELAAKRSRVEENIRRIGGLDLPVEEILGAAQPERYRNKAQFPVSTGPKIGFYRARSHQVIDVADCLLQSEAAARLRTAAKAWMAAHQITA